MTKQAAVLGGVVFGQGVDPFCKMAIFTENFRFFLLHIDKTAVIFIKGKFGRGFFRGVEEKGKNAGRYDEECDIYKNAFGFFRGKESHNYTVIFNSEG